MSFKTSMHTFLWGGKDVEFGDCCDYTMNTLLYILILWLLTFDRWGVKIGWVLVPWLVVCFFIWRAYFRSKKEQLNRKEDEE